MPRFGFVHPSFSSVFRALRGTFSLVPNATASSCMHGRTSPVFQAPRISIFRRASAICIDRGFFALWSSVILLVAAFMSYMF